MLAFPTLHTSFSNSLYYYFLIIIIIIYNSGELTPF